LPYQYVYAIYSHRQKKVLTNLFKRISTDLNGTAVEAFWAGTSFLLTSTVFQPSWASFSHIIGRKPVLLAALVLFTIGAVIASLANNSAVLLVGRSVQGIGGGGIVSLTYVITTDIVTLRERGKWFSLISLQWAIGSVTGPVIGGAFAENTNWRWIFWLNLPFCVIAFVAIPICLHLTHKVGSIFEKLKAFDWFGSFLFISSLTSFLIPLTWGKPP
jgi:MFS family permease